MKLYGALLALCAFSNVWGTTAFVSQAPQSSALEALSMSTRAGRGTATAPRTGNFAGPAPMGTQGSGPALQRSGPSVQPNRGGPRGSERRITDTNWGNSVKVQGSSLRTWSFQAPQVEAVQVSMQTEGRPLNANVDLWQGPDNTPQKMGIYIEDAAMRPFNAVLATPGGQNTVAIRNTAQMEFPLNAVVEADNAGLVDVIMDLEMTNPEIVQGGAVKTYSFSPTVASVQVMLKTDGRPLNARIELLQGPNNNKQVMEIYSEDGTQRPFFAIIESPGSGNVVRIVNTAPLEFPMTARVEPFIVDASGRDGGVIVDGGRVRGNGNGSAPRMFGLPL